MGHPVQEVKLYFLSKKPFGGHFFGFSSSLLNCNPAGLRVRSVAVLRGGGRQQLVLALQELEDGLRQLAAVAGVVAGAPLEGRRPSGLGRGGSHVDGTGRMSRYICTGLSQQD